MFCGWYFRDMGPTGGALPNLPLLLIASTLLLAAVSYFAEKGTASAVKATLFLGVVFLVCQIFVWRDLSASEASASVHPMYAFNFYLMTALHAVHVLGGLVYSVVSLLSFKNGGEELVQRLRNHAVYWHFLGVTWVGILLNLFAIRIPNPEQSFLATLAALSYPMWRFSAVTSIRDWRMRWSIRSRSTSSPATHFSRKESAPSARSRMDSSTLWMITGL